MSLALYFTLTFVISWGGMLLLGLQYGFPATQSAFTENWPIVFLPYLLGPLLSCLITTTVTSGRKGWAELKHIFTWKKVPVYVPFAATIALPVGVLLLLFVLSLFDGTYAPTIFSDHNFFQTILMGISIGLFGGGFLEEPGWTACATDIMKKRNIGPVRTGIIIGIVWGIWHILPTAWGSGDYTGKFDFMLFLPPMVFYIGVLPVYRMIMTMIYYKYSNVYTSILMHMSLTATTLFIIVPRAAGLELVYYYLLLTIILYIVFLIIKRGHVHGKLQS